MLAEQGVCAGWCVVVCVFLCLCSAGKGCVLKRQEPAKDQLALSPHGGEDIGAGGSITVQVQVNIIYLFEKSFELILFKVPDGKAAECD